MDKSFCIAMSSETERRAHVTEQFEKAGLQLDFFDAIDGRKEIPPNVALHLNEYGRLVGHPSVIGCALSHLALWQQILDEPGELFFVCESDVELVDNFKSKLKSCLAETDEPFDILYVGSRYFDPSNKSLMRSMYSRYMFRNDMTRKISSTRYFPDFALASHAYLITKEGARQYLKALSGNVGLQIDFLMQMVRGVRAQAVWPPLAKQHEELNEKSSMFSSASFPQCVNLSCNKSNENEFSPSYWLSCPIAAIGNQPINFWTSIFLALGTIFLYGGLSILLIVAIVVFLIMLDAYITMVALDKIPAFDFANLAWVMGLVITPTLIYKFYRRMKR